MYSEWNCTVWMRWVIDSEIIGKCYFFRRLGDSAGGKSWIVVARFAEESWGGNIVGATIKLLCGWSWSSFNATWNVESLKWHFASDVIVRLSPQTPSEIYSKSYLEERLLRAQSDSSKDFQCEVFIARVAILRNSVSSSPFLRKLIRESEGN